MLESCLLVLRVGHSKQSLLSESRLPEDWPESVCLCRGALL
jgi:hypothetical protein